MQYVAHFDKKVLNIDLNSATQIATPATQDVQQLTKNADFQHYIVTN
jgi:hypothetical protein